MSSPPFLCLQLSLVSYQAEAEGRNFRSSQHLVDLVVKLYLHVTDT